MTADSAEIRSDLTRTAVVLFNLGGPDRPEAVQPFLFNLFYDRAIIDLPNPVRWLVATMASRRRAPAARLNYAKMGGSSPLLAGTREQAKALQALLSPDGPVHVFIAMRYWRPFARDVAHEVKKWEPDRVILLPLYPQFSSTTSGSSLKNWNEAAKAVGLNVPARTVCCYPTDTGLVEAHASLIRQALAEARKFGRPRLLFSAHGLPEKVVAAGDPYQWQIEQTAAAVAAAVGETPEGADLDWTVCYQSRVGPLKWIGPSTEEEIARAGRERVPLVVCPIAFVSEHVETLVELDIDFRERAEAVGIPAYIRVAAVGTEPPFIAGLAELVRKAKAGVASASGTRICPADRKRCICATGARAR
jgi:protoporphyrin/coproporphyrin ferrochelatase